MPSEAAVQLRNTNPLGAVDLYHLRLGHVPLDVGEVFEVPDDVGKELLAQVGNYERVKAATKAEKASKS